jgi:hypothetical protein
VSYREDGADDSVGQLALCLRGRVDLRPAGALGGYRSCCSFLVLVHRGE